MADAAATNKKLKQFYIYCGKKDTLFASNKSFHELLDQRQIKHTFVETEGRTCGGTGGITWSISRRGCSGRSPSAWCASFALDHRVHRAKTSGLLPVTSMVSVHERGW